MRDAHARRIARGEKFGFQKGHGLLRGPVTKEEKEQAIVTFKKNYIPKPKPSCEICGTELWKWKDKRCREHMDYSFRKQNKPFSGMPRNEKRYRGIAERILGRELRPHELIHHINENPSDDRPENLYMFRSISAHMRWHLYIRRHGLPGSLLQSNLGLYSVK